MRKTLQKLLIVTTALTFSCNSFSISAMLKGDNDDKGNTDGKPTNGMNMTEEEYNDIIGEYRRLYIQSETSKKELDEAMNEGFFIAYMEHIIEKNNKTINYTKKCYQ